MGRAAVVCWAVVAAAALAGCLQAPGASKGLAVAVAARGGDLSWSHAGVWTLEPSIAITKDGTVLVGAQQEVYRSTDNGTSWTLSQSLTQAHPPSGVPAIVRDQPSTFDPWLWVDPVTDRAFVDHLWPPLVCTLLATSDDAGLAWTPQRPACASPGVDFEKIVSGPPGPVANSQVGAYPSVVYMCFNKAAATPLVVDAGRAGTSCATSYDGGLTWTNEQVLSGVVFVEGQEHPVAGDCFGGAWPPAVAPDGTVVVRAQPGCLYRTRDSGATWQRIGNGPAEFSGTILAFDKAGTLFALSSASEGPLRLAVSRDQGDSWEPAIQIPLPVPTVFFEAMAADLPGRLALSFYGSRDARIGNATEWTPWVGEVVGADTPDGKGLSVHLMEVPDRLQTGCLFPDQGSDCVNGGDFMGNAFAPDHSVWAVFSDLCHEACDTKAHPTIGDFDLPDDLIAHYVPAT